MKRYTYIIFAMVAMAATTGCNDFLTVAPKSYINPGTFYSTKTEVEIALSGIYGALAKDDVFGQNVIIFDAGTDEGYYNRRQNDDWTVSVNRHTISDDRIAKLWYGLYQSIKLANLFEANLKRSNFPEQEYNRYLAESRFMRGFCYLYLTLYFEEVPLRSKPSEDQNDNNLAPAPISNVYDFIAEDLLFATEHLYHANDPEYVPGRANKMAASGLLARMYLKKAGYPLKDASGYKAAMDQCEIIMIDGWHQMKVAIGDLGYREHFLSYITSVYDTRESLFEISFSYLRNMGIIADGRVGGLNGLRFNLDGGLTGPCAYSMTNASPMLRNLYDPADKRLEWNLPGMYYNNGNAARQKGLEAYYCPGKYRRWEPLDFNDLDKPKETNDPNEPYVVLEKTNVVNQNFTSLNYPILRYSDILLMYAEAANAVNNGPTPAAITALNDVRSRAGLTAIATAATTDKDAFFNELVDERAREFCFEGMRRHDLVRWELMGVKLAQLKSVIMGDPDFVATNDQHTAYLRASNNFQSPKHLSLPYPLQETTINNELKQKDAWLTGQ